MKKRTPKKALLNVPAILTFEDYHQIDYVLNYVNELLGEKLKAKELPEMMDREYAAIFYFKQDDEYKALVKEHSEIWKDDE